jgi:hypothetical protein
MSFLSTIGTALPNLPDLNFCNNNNCSNLKVTCCTGNSSAKVDPKECALNSHQITQNYLSNNQYTVFREYKDGIILSHSSPELHQPDDPTLLCLFADETFTRQPTNKVDIQKMVLDGNHIVAEYQPQRGLWNNVKNKGIIVQLSKDEWDAFQPIRVYQ